MLAKTASSSTTVTDGDGRVRPVRRLRGRPRLTSTRSTTGTSAAAATASGPASRTPSTPCTRCWPRSGRVAAPLLPLITEHVYRALTGERCVHLADWPDPADPARGPGAGRHDGPRPRRVLGRARRPQGQRAARPPAAGVADRGRRRTPPRSAPSPELIADEVNVKDVRLVDDVGLGGRVGPAGGARRRRPPARTRRADVIRAVRAGDWRRDRDTVVAGGIPLEEGEYTLRLVAADEAASASLPGATASSCSTCT